MRGIGVVMAMMAMGCAEPDGVEPVETDVIGDATVYSEEALVVDFGRGVEDRWIAVNDTVMGGVSDGTVDYTDSELVFEGVVSTDSNGGFTSVRSPDDTVDLSDYDRVLVRMRSEGQPFSMVLAHNPYWFQDQFRFDIELDTDEWTVVEIPFEDFEIYTSVNGYPTPTGERMKRKDRKEILHMEFMSKLFEDGPFRLEVDYIAFD